MVGRQTPLLAVVVPADPGLRRRRPARRCGRPGCPRSSCGAGLRRRPVRRRPTTSRCRSTDIVASLVSAAAVVLLLRVWTPAEVLAAEPADVKVSRRRCAVRVRGRCRRGCARAGAGAAGAGAGRVDRPATGDPGLARRRGQGLRAVPRDHRDLLDRQHPGGQGRSSAKEPWTYTFAWPGLDVLNTAGDPVASTTFTFNWLPAAGTLMIIAGIITALILKVSPGRGRCAPTGAPTSSSSPRSSP